MLLILTFPVCDAAQRDNGVKLMKRNKNKWEVRVITRPRGCHTWESSTLEDLGREKPRFILPACLCPVFPSEKARQHEPDALICRRSSARVTSPTLLPSGMVWVFFTSEYIHSPVPSPSELPD